MNMLTIEDLTVKIGKKVILDSINLNLKAGESYIMFGPNGAGKSTLINSIIGNPLYEVESGKILFMDKNITDLSIDERADLGISLAFQNPPEIMGIKLSDLLKVCLGRTSRDEFTEKEKELIKSFNLTKFLDREVNVGFSGGERKRSEILQMLFLKPKLLLLDEPDSGVDVESLKLIASKIQQYIEETGSSALIVTHKGDILEYVKSKYACVLLEGKTHCFVDPKRVYETIKKSGYEQCVACNVRVKDVW